MIFFLVFVTALAISLALTPLAARLAMRTGAVDLPAGRRTHDKPTPRLGGLSITVALFAAVAVSLLYPRTDPNELLRLGGLFAGGVVMFVLGVIDDYHELKAGPQLIVQVIASGLAVGCGVLIGEVPNPFDPFGRALPLQAWFAILFTLFWLVGTMNTVNWLDGVDGLAGGVVVIAGLVMFVHTFRLQQYSIALIALALTGTALGFLPFNFFPARIFLGSAGASVLGFALGILSILGGAKVATALLVLGIPILDVAWQIVSRLRAHKSPFSADRGHLHHRLLDLGLPQRTIVFFYYAFTAVFGAFALILPSGIYKLIALLVIGLGALLLIVALSSRIEKPRD